MLVDGDVDVCYVCDFVFMILNGVILLCVGKVLCRNEVYVLLFFLDVIGVVVLGSIIKLGMVDGGDCVWLDVIIVVVGVGFRFNVEGIE